MKTLFFSTILIVASALFSGCSIGSNSSMVINPFDWKDATTANVPARQPLIQRPITNANVASN